MARPKSSTTHQGRQGSESSSSQRHAGSSHDGRKNASHQGSSTQERNVSSKRDGRRSSSSNEE